MGRWWFFSDNKHILYAFDNGDEVYITPELLVGTVDSFSDDNFIPNPEQGISVGNETIGVERTGDNIWFIGLDNDNKFCGKNDTGVVCGTFDFEDLALSSVLAVGTRCFKDFLPNDERVREVVGLFAGGRYRDGGSGGYKKVVSGYSGDSVKSPAGDLYEFILPTGHYLNPQERAYLPVDTDLYSDLGTVTCEIIEGDDLGYNVLIGSASVRVHQQPIISIEGRKGDSRPDPAGEPTALVSYGERTYDFDNAALKNSGGSVLGTSFDTPDLSLSWKEVGVDLGVGFLVTFGSCYAAGLLIRALSAITNLVTNVANSTVKTLSGGLVDLGLSEQQVLDSTSAAKECGLDMIASQAALDVITSLAKDYVAWAHEGFDDKPFFVQNPTAFYKSIRDDAVVRAIDRSGLGFLCDVKFGGFDPKFNAKIRLDLQYRYSQLTIQPPRCSYNELTNNLGKFFW